MSAYTDYLEHHGIRGQRWGRRNGPPYPLDSSDHSADEKAGKRSPNSSLAGDSHKKLKKQRFLNRIRSLMMVKRRRGLPERCRNSRLGNQKTRMLLLRRF